MAYTRPNKKKPLFENGRAPTLSSCGMYDIEEVVCDKCAEDGNVPFYTDEYGVKTQYYPWCWNPLWGDDCHICGVRC